MIFDFDAPIAMSMSAATLVAVVVSIRKNTRCALALLISLVGARVLTYYDIPALHSLVMFAAFLVCVGRIEGGKFSRINIDKYEVNYLIAVLYIPRMLVVFIGSIGVISSAAMWITSIAFLIVQIGVLIGDSLGYSQHINSSVHRFRSYIHGVDIAQSRTNND